MFREGSPFMEFISVVILTMLCGVGAVFLAVVAPGDAAADVRGFLIDSAKTLLGAVIALAYAARGQSGSNNVIAGGNVTETPKPGTLRIDG